MTLRELKPGQRAKVVSLGGHGTLRRRLAEMGVTPGTILLMRKIAPFGDPMQINLRGYELSLRRGDAAGITVKRF